ncbi:MAG: alanine--tRNA ligase [Gammaproteobacteria bacterium]|nr:alanine--tRNA ligase [Gammaproteobacteria bacterium]
MKTSDIRNRFLEYFRDQGHEIVPSSPLVPGNDPTLLFTNAGMVQFKDVFLGDDRRDYVRAVTAQRCVRAGGKHNDLENVGYTARHHTFFEMLGNFSFGDYFKQHAIDYAWELLTRDFGLSPDRLWVTVFEEDDEAEDLWINRIGMPADRVTRIGAKDNFWQMGDTGPCGPCSEIFYDHGPEVAGGPPGTPEEDGDRYIEIWNLVFMQFNRSMDGELSPLPKPSVDTGMGLERVAAVLQNVHSNYEIDLFAHLIADAGRVLGGTDPGNKSLRVVADHIRSTAFLVLDGVVPANEGRGYVLRRIIRRAVRHGYQLGCREAFLHQLVGPLVREMGDAYPELRTSQSMIEKVLRTENEKFNETLDQGLRILDREMDTMRGNMLDGELVFRLYDTYGFPLDLTADVARERGLGIDQAGFDTAMERQRERARAASKFSQDEQVRLEGVEPTLFSGYSNLAEDVEVVALVQDQVPVQALAEGEKGMLITRSTPFYAESGGQVGDRGEIRFGEARFAVEDTRYLMNRVIAHVGYAEGGEIGVGMRGAAGVTADHRQGSVHHHSATHLLHAALKAVLGNHVQQKGSLVEPARLRFDFSHSEVLPAEQIRAVEDLVNDQIRRNEEVTVEVMELEAARAAGAEALFGEKYDDDVRTIRMGGFSFELCGGTHARRTGDIGLFKIVSETGIAAGVRRIEAVAGTAAMQWMDHRLALLDSAAGILRVAPDLVPERLETLLQQQKKHSRQIQTLQEKLATGDSATDATREINGVRVAAVRQDDADVKTMRLTVDRWRSRLQSGLVLVAGANQGKVNIIAGASKDLAAQLPAGELVAHLAPLVGGKGGGRPELAQGGGGQVDAVDSLFDAAYRWIESRT